MDSAGCEIAVVIGTERGVVGAVELVHIVAVATATENAVDVAASRDDPIGQGRHLSCAEHPVEVGPDGDAVVAVEHRELPGRGGGKVGGQPGDIAGLEGVQQQARQHEVVGPVAAR